MNAVLKESRVRTMPKGPLGEKRPADVIGAAIQFGRIATGEAEDKPSKAPNRAKGGKAGGASRAKSTDSAKSRSVRRLSTVSRLETRVSIQRLS
jgi:hypothetical protein